jgi:tetratricopeptide (TPR) repeat protein
VLVLVDGARPDRLGDLVRGLLATHPDLEVHTSAVALAKADNGALLILVPNPGHADWLNMERPVLAERALRVILFSDPQTSAHLARRAPDFFHWISHRIECPDGRPRFARNGLRAALGARTRGVVWGGGDLEGCFAAALPGRELIRASASLGYEQMVEVARPRGRGWVAWTDVDDPLRLRRVRWASVEAGRRARMVLVEPAIEAPGFVPVHGRMMDLPEAQSTLAAAGAKHPGRLAALLDLEPEAVALAVELLRVGEDEAAIAETMRVANDPGTAIAASARARGLVLGAALQARVADEDVPAAGTRDEVEALLHAVRTGKARWDAAAKAALEAGDREVSEAWAARERGPGAAPRGYQMESMRDSERPRLAELSAEATRLPPGIEDLHEAALQAGLGHARDALLAGIDAAFVAGLNTSSYPPLQLLWDLAALNSATQLRDGSVPLVRWLENAATLAGTRPQAAVFRAALDRLAGRAAPLGGPKVSVARLPATGKELFGRGAELAWLDVCWREHVHVASIVAWGGVGKTALVNRWLAAMRDKGWDGAERVYCWSFYSQGTDRLTSSDEFVDAALRWFGDPDPARGLPWDRGERLAGLVRKQRTILVLDGVEPLQWGPGPQEGKLKDPALQALVAELCGYNQGSCIITSRIALRDLDAQSGAKVRELNLDTLSPESGAALLRARGVNGAEEELEAASREYGGNALALMLLGAFLVDVAGGDIQRRKEIAPPADVERQDGVLRVVMAAYERRLGATEIAILRMLGLFDRPAAEDELAAVRAEPPIPGLTEALAGLGERDWSQAVTKLQRVGLLSVQVDRRLDAHPLVREHFGEQLRREHPDAFREGHRRLYEHLKRTAKALPETVEEMAPLYAAVVHGCLAGKNQEALVEVLWKRIYRGDEGYNWRKLGAFGGEVMVLGAFFDLPWKRLRPGLREPEQAWILGNAGFALRALGRSSEAAELMRLGLELRIAQQDWKNAAQAAANLSGVLESRGELREALWQARQSVEFADRSGDAAWRMAFRTTLAATLHALGLLEEALMHFEEAERLQAAWRPDQPLLSSVQGFEYCDLLLDQGRISDVEVRATQTLAWAEAHFGLLSIALDHLSLGRARLLAVRKGTAGSLAQAASHLDQAVAGLRRAGDQAYLPLGLLARAALHTCSADFTAARRDLNEALALAERSEFRLHEADAHLGLAHLALAEGDQVVARGHLAKARAIVERTGYHRRDAELSALEATIAAAAHAPEG